MACCYNELGKYFEEEAYYITAIGYLEQGLDLGGDKFLLEHTMGISYLWMGDLTDDEEHYQQALLHFSQSKDFARTCPSAYNNWGLALLRLGDLLHDEDYIAQAVEKFRLAIEGGEQTYLDPDYLYNYACALDFLGDFTEDSKDYEESIKVLSELVSMDPERLDVHYNLALSLTHLGSISFDLDYFHRAIDEFRYVTERDPEDEMAWNEWGTSLINLAQVIDDNSESERLALYQEAEEKLLRAASLGSVLSFYNLVCLNSLQENYIQALHYLEKAKFSRALPPVEEILEDEWLENMQKLPAFKKFIESLR